MNTITLFRKLKERGYATNSAITWSLCDLTDALYRVGYTESDVFAMDDDDRSMLLDDFFRENEDAIVEFIHELLTIYAKNITSLTPTKDLF